ncbi:hypothetical protein ERO13_D11G027550v2 [Gossypium hirsutum]|nr:hypothetical protein ERO13_D11G027550v2 [Gossypium hirsutum]
MESHDSFGQSDSDVNNSGGDWKFPFGIPDASSGITMVSPPESPPDNLPNDLCAALHDGREIFHSPRYKSTSTSSAFYDCNDDEMIDNHGGKTASADTRRAVDLGKDIDLGFSEEEVDSARKIKSTSNSDGPKKKRVLPSQPLDFGTELPSLSYGKAEDGEKADEEPNVNETGTVHSDTNASRLNDNFRKIKLLDVLLKLAKDCEEDESLVCLSLLEVAERKWGKF